MPETRATRPLSPSRLNAFLGCDYRAWLDVRVERGELQEPSIPRPDAKLLQDRGMRHEERFLDALRAAGRDVVSLAGAGRQEAALRTEAAMDEGREVIHQACFADGGWVGFADFLVRVDAPSARWGWSYEVYDAKLARDAKPNYIFQLLFYTEQVERLQGAPSKRMHLILGDGEHRSFRPEDFSAYAAQVREHFLARRAELADGAEPVYPYPVADCDFCPWWRHCADKRRDEDHLSLVALLQRSQGVKLEAEGVRSVADVAAVDEDVRVPGLPSATLENLRRQARLQVRSIGRDVPEHEYRDLEHGRGFHRLPEPSAGDVFFDFEGDPYWGEDGLEYLFGTVFADADGEWRYEARWAHDAAGERRAFEAWIDWVTARLARHPDMHVYHFNHYEPTALKKLMSRYATREHEVDELLRRQVFVDLYTVVRQALRVGTESYGLKAIEALYRFVRRPDMQGGAGAARRYEAWRETQDPRTLAEIAAYNEDDCRSTLALRAWLLAARAAAEVHFDRTIDSLEPTPEREPSEEAKARRERLEALRAALTRGLPEDEDARSGDERALQRMADLVDYHAREKKPAWWAFFARLGMTPDELRDEDSEALGGLELATDVERREHKASWEHPLRFPPQQWKLGPGDNHVDPETGDRLNIVEVDEERSLVWLRRGKRSAKPLPRAIIPGGPYNTAAQEDALVALAERIAGAGLRRTGEFDASVALLAAEPPRFAPEAPPLRAGDVDLGVLCDQVAALDGSALFVQGPPGSGKTYTGGRLAVDLIRRGVRVGVAATSHNAIGKLLEEIDAAADEAGVEFAGQKKSSADPDSVYESARIRSSDDNAAFPPPREEVQLIAGSAWLWAREDLTACVDVLFIDEAGQVSLADALAMARGARNVVLLGDPQQLAHVSQGTHPRGSGRSVLEHLLDGADTVPADRGVFLNRTWRLHPDVCGFVSRTMYDGLLRPVPECARQAIASPGLSGTGLRMLEVEHAERRQSAPEEADAIAAEIERLLDGGRWTDRHGAEHPITLQDILVVAPFNAQVRCLRQRLPEGARVGSVDKFQGQEAPVVFFSMTSSSGDDVPRGMDFLFSRNRLNVAVSRAQALAVVVCSPRLLWTRCRTIEQMRLVNLLCRFAEEAAASPH